MKTVLTAKISKENENYTILNRNISQEELIRLAANAVLETLKTEGYDLSTPCILCGGGNNGADGMALACMLKEAGAQVTVLYLGELYNLPALSKKSAKKKASAYDFDPALIGTPKTEEMSDLCRSFYKKVLAAEIDILTALPQNFLMAEQPIFSVIVDAVYGTGMHGAITNPVACDTFDQINQCTIPVVAVDIPSGVDPDTGAMDAHTLYAAQTVTMQHAKSGLMLYPGADYAGEITEVNIGIEEDPRYRDLGLLCLEDEDIASLLPIRPTRAFKGTFGRVLVVAGCPGMAGAAYMAAAAAYRAGAGLVEVVTHVKNRATLQQLLPEAIILPYADKRSMKKALKIALLRADAIVLGCGLGQNKHTKFAVKMVLNKAKAPLVLDADALSLLGQKPAWLKRMKKQQKAQTVITPHAAEAARLLGKKITSDRVMADVYTSSQALCEIYKVNVLLKDARTIIRSHDGKISYINLSGSTALAGAGSGDILAGMIGGLSAAKTNALPTATTAALAAYLHGKAGEAAELKVGARAAMARDILNGLTEFNI